MKKTLNIVGCGRVGRSFARLFAQSHAFELQDLLDQGLAPARACARFAEAGRAVPNLAALRSAKVWLIATPDGAIVETCNRLVEAGKIRPRDVVCHCSGATPSSDLLSAREAGAWVASFHPLKSFANPAIAAASFRGTFVALEGDRKALKPLRPALRRIGAKLFEIEPQAKVFYHAASVIVCNYLTALMEAGLRCYERSGIPIETAYALMEPLVRETVDNVFRLGTVRALTGPIARGDHALVARQMDTLADCDPDLGELYRRLGRVALGLARSQGSAQPAALRAMEKVLRAARPAGR